MCNIFLKKYTWTKETIMRRSFFILLVLFMFGTCYADIIHETGSFKNFLFGRETACEYDRWMSHISEGIAIANYNLYAPWDRQTNGFGAFHQATTTELTQCERIPI